MDRREAVNTSDLKPLATICDMLESAFDDGHASAMEECARTDEQRLHYISELHQALTVILADYKHAIYSDSPVSIGAWGRIRTAEELLGKNEKPRQVQVISLEACERLAKKSQQMRREYRSSADCCRNAGAGLSEDTHFQNFHGEPNE
jgi:hypothetical protein